MIAIHRKNIQSIHPLKCAKIIIIIMKELYQENIDTAKLDEIK